MLSKERKGKWQPFDALAGYKDSLRNLEYERGKIVKPELSADALEEMNQKIIDAIENKKEVKVIFYKDGYLHDIIGSILSVDCINRKLILSTKKLDLYSLIDIEII